MKRRIISGLLVASMAFALLTGCGNKSEKESTESSGDENTLTVWCWDPAFNINAIQEAEKIYQKDNPEFKLEVVETPWEDLQTKVTTAASSNQIDTLPDIVLMQDDAFQKNVISYPDAFVDLTDTGIDYSQFAEGKVSASIVDGANYGVPFDNGAVIACYREDILEQAGFTTADFEDITWDKYIEQGKVVLEKTGKPLLSCLAGETDVLAMMLRSAGGGFFDEEGNALIADNKILKEVVETYIELVKSGVLIEVNDWDQYIGSLNNETVAGTINGCWIMASIQTAEDQAGKWKITNMPKLDGASSATNYANQGGSSWAVTKGSKNPELAADFLGSTFGGSVELYDNILSTGAIATYQPAADSEKYAETNDFFGGEEVYTKIVEYAGQVPDTINGVYFYEARDAVGTAITNIIAGADIDAELKTAQETVEFSMQ
ncbi:lactose/L-arabinose transport system substrate-binding protein [Lachnospiraceae bacterium PF1-21]|uniref:Extracellular solute-binding protein n=1 Tax=Ohessyouella blattaphilus TaxID=2949333 RepID=A0ABT1EKY1_9FIRM|nr:extracellular solute-binding protein [Ohessyouella blattaphilus]MCP1111363.1 extracellular solute-binding protein [Ohessyouella blattaphilus]MCR8564757.1 extracellular solute-binding protein [Ohessyouella blattaphilus]MDL2250800.1 extracellular solute-binding protein [Lachnospiraceae bacterium OttesenSCG-928-J05]